MMLESRNLKQQSHQSGLVGSHRPRLSIRAGTLAGIATDASPADGGLPDHPPAGHSQRPPRRAQLASKTTQSFYGSSYLVVLSWIIVSSRALIGLLTLGAGTHFKRRKAAMQLCFLVALLVASTAGAAAQQGTLAAMPPPAMPALSDGTFNVDNLPDGPLPASLFDFRSQALIVCLRHAA